MDIKQKNGISLIVLVITIIVMIILASAIILSLRSSGIIGRANEAVEKSDIANAKNVVSLAYAEWELDEGELKDTYASFAEYAKAKLSEAGFTEEQITKITVFNDGSLQVNPVIPEGFVMSPYEGEQKTSEGLVIYEASSLESISQETAMTTYNQYVWVPVPDMDKFKITQTNTVDNKYKVEPLTESTSLVTDISLYADEIAQYNEMRASVEKHGGFYIARYEAGLQEGKTTDTVAIDGTDKPVSKKGANVWTNIKWDSTFEYDWDNFEQISSIPYGDDSKPGAALVAKKAYEASTSVGSHLIYGVQWDAALTFISTSGVKDTTYATDSTGKGWYNDNYALGNPEHKTGIDVDSNASNRLNNIYDMAGNVEELTSLANSYIVEGGARVARGGIYFLNVGASMPASYYSSVSPDSHGADLGFRVALYLK